MSTETTNSTLTAGQAGVIDMYDRWIIDENRLMNAAYSAFDAGTGSYEEIRYHRDQLEDLTRERRETLAQFQASV